MNTPLRRATIVILALLCALPAVAQRRHAAPPPPRFSIDGPPPVDVFSGADLTVRATHISLDLTVDFDKTQLRGSVTETISNPTGATKFIVDTRDLTISGVKIDGATTTWSWGTAPSSVGTPLVIDILPSTKLVRIDYASTNDPKSPALNWLTALATDGDKAPFFYTLGEPVRTRNWIPIQDTNAARVTYDAHIHVPAGLMAVMSSPDNPKTASSDGNYSFSMPHPIPPYLIALAVGRMQFHALSDRTGFYAEPENVESATSDLRYLPSMLDAAERLLGPYPFDRYDIVLMPPNFHAGGMENPNANFINILSAAPGNHDPVPDYQATIAHEMAHSWTGDLVTCATWNDTWLNEGFATYYQARILDEMNAPELAEAQFYWQRGAYHDYVDIVKRTPEATEMHRLYNRGDSVQSFNTASYSKGALFLKMIEDTEGRPAFDAFVRDYLDRYRDHWADDRAFLELLQEHFGSLDQLHAIEWVYGMGFPPNITAPTTAAIWTRANEEAAAYIGGQSLASLGASSWTPLQRDLFLWAMGTPLESHLADVDAALQMSSKQTVQMNWWVSIADTRYAPAMPRLEAFLMRGGGNVANVYQRLVKTPAGFQYALDIYKKARPQYDYGTQAVVDGILHFSPFAVRNVA